MIRGYYTAASAARANQDRMNTLSNNIANSNVVGYKQNRDYVRGFNEQLVSRLSTETDQASGGQLGQLGTGSAASMPTIDLAPGTFSSTGLGLDVALNGPGYLVVQTPAGQRLTRAGSMQIDTQGRLAQPDGALVLGANGPITVGQPNALPAEVNVNEDGQVMADGRQVGQLRIVECPDNALQKSGMNYFEATNPAQVTNAQQTTLMPGVIEEANVDMTQTTIDIMGIMRSYGTVRELIRIQDEVLGRTVGEVGRVG